jgi:hypothetical protein
MLIARKVTRAMSLLLYHTATPQYPDKAVPRARICRVLTSPHSLLLMRHILLQIARSQNPQVCQQGLNLLNRNLVYEFAPNSGSIEVLTDDEFLACVLSPTRPDDEAVTDLEDVCLQLSRFVENILLQIVQHMVYFFNVLEAFPKQTPQMQNVLLNAMEDIVLQEDAVPVQTIYDVLHSNEGTRVLKNLALILAYELNDTPRILGIIPLPKYNLLNASPHQRFIMDTWLNPVDHVAMFLEEIVFSRNEVLLQCQQQAAYYGAQPKGMDTAIDECSPVKCCSVGCVPETCSGAMTCGLRLRRVLDLYSLSHKHSVLCQIMFPVK